MARGWCAQHYLRWWYTQGATVEPYRPAPKAFCLAEGCSAPVRARGWCNRHYLRWWGKRRLDLRTDEERFWAKVEKTPTCWFWRGARINTGYGVFRRDARAQLAHRVAYEWAYGTVLPFMTIDHLCYEPACVRPEHLEAVTQGENNRRARARKLAARIATA